MTTKLHVHRLPVGATDAELQSLFEGVGRVIQVSEFDTAFERVKRNCADLASEMQCPHHFTNAKVEIAGEDFDDFSMEVITCCDEFRRRVEEVLDTLVKLRVCAVASTVSITKANAH